ncbi:MAG: amino acid adenylation protein [Planctomycetaceae bacterium]|nr:amino acid adenylation protein [Planctomycetaceae bacterium]
MPQGVSSPRQYGTIVSRDGLNEEPRLLHEFFARAATLWPENIAVDVPPSTAQPFRRTITYAELGRQTDVLAAYLREFVTRECVVAILLPRNSEHIYLAQLAVLKAGAAYVCIDPSFPDAQVGTILTDASPVAVLTDATGVTRVRATDHTQTCVMDVVGWLARLDSRVANLGPADWLTPHSLAYLIYTSGTTGRPKGVMIEHAAIANLMRGDLITFPCKPEDRVGQNSSCAYDSSVEEIWMAFAAGATLVVMDDETTRLGPDLVAWLHREGVTVFSPPPTLLRACGGDIEHSLPDLERIHVGGEPLPRDVADRWAPGRTLVNDYGPTECAVVALRSVIRAGDPITIGRPVPGIHACVLNSQLEEVPDGETGELCLSGAGLARGYLKDPELTARKFPVHPRLGRIYRTGDLVHRDAEGNYYCHGRIDTQVKIRGYRIELEAIESRLTTCEGVREAACRVQGEGSQQQIVAFIVANDPAHPPHFDDLKAAVRKQLPEYMVPAHFGVLASLPLAVSGKLNRRALPTLEIHAPLPHGHILEPRNESEHQIATAVRRVLNLSDTISVDHDFFNDLGGDSLRAAVLISTLRDDPTTASLTVRDLYETRTIAGLAKRITPRVAPHAPPTQAERPIGHPILATLIQSAWLLIGLILAGPFVYLVAVEAVPDLTQSLGLVPFLLLSPLMYLGSMFLYTVAAVLFTVCLKKLLIGRYQPCREPVWGGFYIRNWIVRQAAGMIPWTTLEGTVFKNSVLRMLGARIGARVHIHRGVDMNQGGWDLLEIGDDVTLSQEAGVRIVELEAGQIVVAPVSLGNGCTLDVRAGVAGNTRVEPDGYLTPLSFLTSGSTLPRGERWEGVPAVPAGRAPNRPAIPSGQRELSPAVHGLAMLLGRVLVAAFVATPLIMLGLLVAFTYGIDAHSAIAWVMHPALTANEIMLGVSLIVLTVPLMLVSQCLALRILGRVPEGVISRWSVAYIRVWLKTGIMNSANSWLSGTLLWRVWLRCAGMKIGRNSEIGTIIDTVPEMVEIGSETFFADGIYLAGPHLYRGTATLAMVRLGNGDFLGNHVVVPPGQTIPDGVLLGVCTLADDTRIRPGTSWFGHPPFELPNREVVEADRSVTHNPSWPRYINRVFWELLRFTIPLVPVFLAVGWFAAIGAVQHEVSFGVLVFGVVPALDLAFASALCVVVLALKWLLLGKVKPGTHPLWSCWCSRWDFHYVLWEMYARGPLAALEGTLLLNVYLRAMGVKIGKNVVLGSGFSHVVDPDMLSFADGSTVSAMFQAHTFEDRVLKIDYVTIGTGATLGNASVLLYGADVGTDTRVVAHSVVMKRERLQPGSTYAGCPTRAL